MPLHSRFDATRSLSSSSLSVPRCIAVGLALALIPLVAGCGGAPKQQDLPTARLLSAAERELHLQSFDQVWSTISETHWDSEKIGEDWSAMRDELRPMVERAKTDREVQTAFDRLIGSLGQTHFVVLPPEVYDEISGEEVAEEANPGRGGASSGSITTTVRNGEAVTVKPPKRARNPEGTGDHGLDLVVIDGEAVISRVDRGSGANRAGIQLGWILEAVDGRPVSRTIENFSAVSTEGELGMMLHHVIRRGLKGDEGEVVDLTLRDGAGESHELSVTLGPERGKTTKFGHMPPVHVEWQLERREEIGYFRLSSFFEPGPVRSAVAEFIDENTDAKGFVIDLRGNPGGIGFMANGLSGLFVEESGQSLGTMITRESELNFGIYPQSTTYPGPLAILIDGGSASTSEIMAAGLQDIGRARLFGTTTAGAALPSVFVRLPNGNGFQYAIANYVSAGGDVLEGSGVAPDVRVEPNREALLRGIDPVYDAARSWIRQQSLN